MALSAVYSWHLPNAGDAFWAETFARLIADIDLTVGSLQGIVSGRPTLVFSGGGPSSGVTMPASEFSYQPGGPAPDFGMWTPFSFAPGGPLTGYYTTIRAGSYLRSELAMLNHDRLISGSDVFIPIGNVQDFGFRVRVVMNPGSLLLFGTPAVGFGTNGICGQWTAVTPVTTPGLYAFEAQICNVDSRVTFYNPSIVLFANPITLICTEVRSQVI